MGGALFSAGIWAAKQGKFEAHKRLIFIGTLNLLGPAHTRLGAVLGWSTPTLLLAVFLTWILPPIAYDLLTRRSIHRVSIAGIVFSMATFALMVVITLSPVMGWIETRLFPEAGVL